MKFFRFVPVAAAALLVAAPAMAQEDQHQLTYQVDAINEISVDETAVILTINQAMAGSAPTDATGTSSYAITTNQGGKITVALSEVLPSGVTLTANLQAPDGDGTESAGPVALGTTAVDAVTRILPVAQSGLDIDYVLSATVEAGVVASDNVDVVFTIVPDAS